MSTIQLAKQKMKDMGADVSEQELRQKLKAVLTPTEQSEKAMREVGIAVNGFHAMANAALAPVREMGVAFEKAARDIGQGLATGLVKWADHNARQNALEKRPVLYQRHAMRWNARPRRTKRHGERRGVV